MKSRVTFTCIALLLLCPLAHAKIVFVGGRMPEVGKEPDIYVMDDDGSNLRNLTNTPERERNPRWSPDGKHIAFEREFPREGSNQVINIFMMDADGTNERRLTYQRRLDTYPIFLPDGKHLCFLTGEDGKNFLYILHLESGDIKRRIEGFIATPSWSPDRQHIVYEDRGDIYIMGSNFRNRDALLPWPLRDKNIPEHIEIGFFDRKNAQWSPDGGTVVYRETTYSDEGHPVASNVFLHDMKTNTQEKLGIHKDWRVHRVDWMGNGRTLILAADELGIKNRRHGTYNIYRYHIPSNTMTQLTDLPGRNYSPDWIEGTLDVSPQAKEAVSWGQLKRKSE